MDQLLQWAKRNQPAVIRTIQSFVKCESPSDSPDAVRRFMKLVADSVSGHGAGRIADNCLVWSFRLRSGKKNGQVLALGHGDTVWPLGTLRTMKWKRAQGRLWGPGVLDMKAGVAFFIYAMRALRELEIPVPHEVAMMLVPDEETGSRNSRKWTELKAKQSHAVLVLEPGTGLEGNAKTARKGIGDYRVTVRGVAAHSGLDFTKGASAVVELAKQIERIAGFTNLERGITVNPGVISGGTRSNVIAAEASVHVDVRTPKVSDAEAIDRKFRALKAIDKRCTIEVSGGVNRPPMERSAGGAKLFGIAREAAAELEIALKESSVGGGSDGNFAAALGIPTLDGLGAVGEGAHADHESILIDRIADRIALLAKLTSRAGIERV